MKKFITLFLLFLATISCKDKNQQDYKPESIGAINSLAVVIDNGLWEGKVGDKIREYFAATVVGLPWEEPLFSLDPIPPQVFTATTRHRRSVLHVSLDSLDLAHVKTNLYARPQKVAVVKGKTEEEIINNLETHAEEIIEALKKMEIEQSQERFLRSLNKEQVLQEKFGVSINLPSIYKVGKQEENFVWIDRQIQKGTMNIIAYEMPNDYFKSDSTLVKDIVRMRDSIGSLYVPGPDMPNKTTYMRTEPAFAPYVYPAEIGGRKAVEVRGIWDIKNYPMARQDLHYIINDEANSRKLVMEGFTFAPATNKRDYMFELEAIMKTLSFVKPE